MEDISQVAIEYFETLFTAGTCSQVDDCLNTVEHKVTPNMHQILSSDFTTDEIKAAVFQMGLTKASGPDGMNAHFYQKFWYIVGDNVVTAVLDYLNSGVMGPDVNHTNIVLIPKIKTPKRMSGFRPISLCNVLYKIISKVLANRLKQILPSVISSTQSGFVLGRLITDKLMVAYEVLHSMHSRKTGKKGSLALKRDISKAYDRVEWGFLQGIMTKLGFPERWVQRVMGCVTTPTFSILINGKAYGNIRPSRGIRQGDPLSPYLFLLCVEGFTSLLQKAELDGRIKGALVCRRVPRISNLMFADDSIIFCRAMGGEVEVINEVFQIYANASGQCINMEKSSVYFSSNTQQGQKAEIVSMLVVKVVERFESYLGLPTLVGRAKYQTFSYLKDRVWKKLQGWKGMMLSRAGKEVLIKAVIQAIPTYTMGVFLLPVKLCEKLNALCAKFW